VLVALADQVCSSAALSYFLVSSAAAVVGVAALAISWGKIRGPVPIAN